MRYALALALVLPLAGCSAVDTMRDSISDSVSDPMLTAEGYARAAVDQNRQQEALGCGYSGDYWSNNYEGHRSWASDKTPERRRDHDYRERRLAECRAR